jgi:aminopeptidase N
VESIELSVELDPDLTRIACSQVMVRANQPAGADLVLTGRGFRLNSIAIDGRPLLPNEYLIREGELVLVSPPERFVLATVTEISPRANRAALGMFMDGPAIITHMEADGFSRLVYCLDRPDIMSRYDVRLIADPVKFPVLLSNGERVDQGAMPDGRHFALWRDTTPKSSYIFGIAAGPYARLSDVHVDGGGRSIALTAYASPANIARCRFLLGAIKRVMTWDEEAFGRKYDLDSLNILVVETQAISQENKGLIFLEAAYALADEETSTDEDFDLVERIAAHEYLHNWTGNRVTCRDWFQLSVKEGLTRFRDQIFSAAMSSPDVKRIATVRSLRTNQFAEDAGGGAHPVQPKSYGAVSNLYSGTVYDKGAEIVRMAHTLLGPERFRAGLDLFFDRHDLSAITIEDLLNALSDGGGEDLGQFARWYHQPGTPRVSVKVQQDLERRTVRLELSQRVTVADQANMPLRIPLRLGLVTRDGRLVDVKTKSGAIDLIDLVEVRQTIELCDVGEPVVVSCNRGFSAPVIVEIERSASDLALLLRGEKDGFARWDAGQELMIRAVLEEAGLAARGDEGSALDELTRSVGEILQSASADEALAAELLSFPHVGLIAERLVAADMGKLTAAWIAVRERVAVRNVEALLSTFHACVEDGPVSLDVGARARRRLRSVCLEYLLETGEAAFRGFALAEVKNAPSMTAQSTALHALCQFDCDERVEALAVFKDRWSSKADVMRLWLRAQALSRFPGAAERVRELADSPVFDIGNAPQAMALLGSFFRQNRIGFHAADGSGYRFLADTLLTLDRVRPHATRWLMPQLLLWRRFDAARSAMMKAQIERLAASEGVSAALAENLARAIAAPPADQERGESST